jgi:hypothetical protein
MVVLNQQPAPRRARCDDLIGLPTTWVLPTSPQGPRELRHARRPHTVEEEKARPTRLLVVANRRLAGAGPDARASSRASVRGDAAKTTASTRGCRVSRGAAWRQGRSGRWTGVRSCRRRGPSGPRGGELVLVELQQVVGGGDQAPFRSDRRSSPSVEAVDAAVELGVSEDGLDQFLSLSVELGAVVGFKDAGHERVEAAVPSWASALAAA